ncbi:MAG: PAS domain S-box protein, partial [Candidatus Thorarchaeota archaeon]
MHLDEKTSSQKNNSALPNLNKTLLKVKESIKSAESVFEVLNIRFALYDLNENLIYTSKNTEKIIGYSEEDFKLLSIFGYVHPDDREKVIKEFKKFRKTDFSDTINYRIFRPTGEMCWIRGAAHRYLNEKTHEHIATFIMEYDISEEKGKIPETIEEQKIYQEILELTKHPILYTKNFQIQWASKNWKDYFKYTDDFIRNKSIEFLFLDQDEYARYLFECNRDLKKNGFIEFEVKLQDSLKQCHLNRLSVVTSDKNDLSKGMVLSFVEITDQKNDEIARETSLSYYESIIANANIGILRIVDNKIEYFNQALLRQLDFKHDDLINQDLSVIFPTKENYKIFLSEMNKAFLNNENFEKQLNLIAKDRR